MIGTNTSAEIKACRDRLFQGFRPFVRSLKTGDLFDALGHFIRVALIHILLVHPHAFDVGHQACFAALAIVALPLDGCSVLLQFVASRTAIIAALSSLDLATLVLASITNHRVCLGFFVVALWTREFVATTAFDTVSRMLLAAIAKTT